MSQFKVDAATERILPNTVDVGGRLSADWLNRIRKVTKAVTNTQLKLSGTEQNIINDSGRDIPPYSVLEITGAKNAITQMKCTKPTRAGLSRVVFTRQPILADTSGYGYEGGIQVARCLNPVVGKYAQTRKNRFWLQFCETGPFRVLTKLTNVPWLSKYTNYVLVDCAGEKDTDITVTVNSANPRNIRVLDFVGFSVVDNGNGTLTVS